MTTFTLWQMIAIQAGLLVYGMACYRMGRDGRIARVRAVVDAARSMLPKKGGGDVVHPQSTRQEVETWEETGTRGHGYGKDKKGLT